MVLLKLGLHHTRGVTDWFFFESDLLVLGLDPPPPGMVKPNPFLVKSKMPFAECISRRFGTKVGLYGHLGPVVLTQPGIK